MVELVSLPVNRRKRASKSVQQSIVSKNGDCVLSV